jgi:hypothetical protein
MTGRVVADATPHRKPAPVISQDGDPLGIGLAQQEISHRKARLIWLSGQHFFEGLQCRRRLAPEVGDHGVSGYTRPTKRVTGTRHINSTNGHRRVARQVVGQRVEDPASVFEITRWRNLVQIGNRNLDLQRSSPTFEVEHDRLADMVIQQLFDRQERIHEMPGYTNDHVPHLEGIDGGTPRHDLPNNQHSDPGFKGGPDQSLGLSAKTEPSHLIEGLMPEHDLNRPARDFIALANQFDGAFHPIQRQIETRGRPRATTRIQRDDSTINVDDRRSRGSS